MVNWCYFTLLIEVISPHLYTLEDERLEPTAITYEKKGKSSEPNLQGIMEPTSIFRSIITY